MLRPSIIAVLIAGLVLAATGCAGNAARPTPPAERAVPQTATTLTIANILQWPLEGPAGYARLVDMLNGMPGMVNVSPAYRMTHQSIRLADGYTAVFISVRKMSERIDMGLHSVPCLAPEPLQSSMGATASKSSEDMHGNDVGMSYWVSKNGTVLEITTTPYTWKCVASIHIVREKAK